MSWFSLIKEENNVLNSQSFFDSALTGQFIGKYAVDQLCSQSETYNKVKETVGSFFIHQIFSEIESISHQISEKLVNRIKTDKSSKLPQIVKKILGNTLESFYRKVIQNGTHIFVQKQIESHFDAFCEKGISLAIITGIYSIAINTLYSSSLNMDSYIKPTLDYAYKYLPSPSRLLAALTTFHTLEMVYVAWKASFFQPHHDKLHHHCDKEEIKQLIVEQLKEPIKITLQEKPTYKIIRMALNEQKTDALITFLVNELMDHFYWKEIHHARFLNLPLVC